MICNEKKKTKSKTKIDNKLKMFNNKIIIKYF